jgi:hypothetical protein
MPNNFDAFIPEVWSTRVIEKLYQSNLALALLANTDYEGEIKNQGDTVQVRTFGRVTVSNYSRSTPINYEALAPTKEPMTINDAKYVAFQVDDLDDAQSDIDPMTGYVREGAVAIDETIDTKVFSYVTSANTSNQISNSGSAIDIASGTAGATHVYDNIVAAGKCLDDQNAPQDGRWLIVSPYFKSLLLKDVVYFIKGSALGDTLLTTGRPGMTARTAPNFIGQIAGFDVYWSNNLPTNGSNRYCPFGQGRPIAYAAQLRKSEMIRLESTFASAFRSLLLHDGKLFTEPAKRLGYIYVDNS